MEDVRSIPDETTLTIADGGLNICFGFETEGSEVQGCLETVRIDCDDRVVPDLDAHPPLRVCARLSLAYDPTNQYFSYDDAEVRVTADWQLTGDRAGVLNRYLREKFNPEAEQKIKERFLRAEVKRPIEFQLNDLIRRHVVLGGRITSATFEPDRVVLQVERP